jgi:predicted small integral membrane protein
LIKHDLIPAEHEQNIMEVLQVAAVNEATLKTKMADMIDNQIMQDVEREMSAIISQERVDLIKKSFTIETYKMKVFEKSGQSAVQVHRKGVEFQPERMLMSIEEIQSATELQWASLVVELFIFVLNCVGIGVDLSEDEMRTVAQEVERIVQEMQFQQAIINFVDAWNKAGDSTWKMAKAIFSFLADVYELNMFWTIIKLIIDDMSTWETIRALAEVSLTIVAAFATEGFALIARIALAVDSAVHLAEKIANLNTFSEMKKTMN